MLTVYDPMRSYTVHSVKNRAFRIASDKSWKPGAGTKIPVPVMRNRYDLLTLHTLTVIS